MAARLSDQPEAAAVRPHSPSHRKQGPFCIWHGVTFGSWMRILAQRPRVDWSQTLRLASITAVSLINSLESSMERLRFRRRLEQLPIEHPPVFIIGHWRSGTTLLHNLLTLDPQFTHPNLYQVLYSGHFLTTERLVAPWTKWLLPKTRMIDDMPASWDMTQEDEIAMLLATGISPYLMLACQGERAKYSRYFSLEELSPSELATWKRSFLTLLKKLTYRSPRQIVLKSPPHTYRIPVLLEMFPGAKFIYIHRDPYAVLNSSIHLRYTLFTANSLGTPNLEGLEEDTIVTYEDCIRTYERTKDLIPAGQLHEMRFDRLETDLLGEMRTLYQALNLGNWDAVEPALRAKLPELSKHRKNKFVMEDEARRTMYQRLKWIFELYGYPSQLDAAPETRHLSAAG